MSKCSSNWLAKNWVHLLGIPRAGAEWMLRDIPIDDKSTLLNLKMNEYVRVVEEQRTVPESRTKPATKQDAYGIQRDLWDDLDRIAKIDIRVFEAFAGRPEADAYVVDLFAASSPVARDVEHLRSEEALDVQLVGVDTCAEPADGYPGRWVRVDEPTLTNPFSPFLSALPAADVLAVSPGQSAERAVQRILRQQGSNTVLVDPRPGMVEQALKVDLALTDDPFGQAVPVPFTGSEQGSTAD